MEKETKNEDELKTESPIDRKNLKLLLLISAFYELFLSIPILGNTLVWEYSPFPMLIACLLHTMTLMKSMKLQASKFASIFALFSLSISGLPLIGWAFHLAAGTVILTSVILKRNEG